MAVLSKSDRIAIVVIMTVILAGWGIRFFQGRGHERGLVVYRQAVPIPAVLDSAAETTQTRPFFAPLDINIATREDLQGLPLIGPARADDIVRYREEHGRFTTPEDIMKVPGIGPGIFERIQNDIRVSAEPGN